MLKVALAPDELIYFWNHYRNRNRPDYLGWGSGRFRYLEAVQAIYTDGLTEAQNRAGEEYGTDRLAAHLAGLARQPGLSARDLTTACVRDLAGFRGGAPANDDLTIMIVRRT